MLSSFSGRSNACFVYSSFGWTCTHLVYLLGAFLLAPSMVDVLLSFCRGGIEGNKGDGGNFSSFSSRLIANAAPCTPSSLQTFEVSPSFNAATNNLSSVFDCEDGLFEVTWSGVVSVASSIKIGARTSVSIAGDFINSDSTTITTTNDSVASASTAFGPIFVVDGGELSLKGLIVRGGNATALLEPESIATTENSGGGIHAVNATVRVTGCLFEDNYGTFMSGGLFANRSTVVVHDTAFRECEAGLVPEAGDEDVLGQGGGIGVDFSELLVVNSSFESCYAAKKGGAIAVGNGNFSLSNSTFEGNNAGSANVQSEEPVGEGGDLVVSACVSSFEGSGSCFAETSTFTNAHVGRKGGSIQISDGTLGTSRVEFHGCTFLNASAGLDVEDDAQGEGGVFSVGAGGTLILVDTVIEDAYAGKKGGAIALSGGENWSDDPGGIVIMRDTSFNGSTAADGSGGVIYLNEHANVTIQGDGNVFLLNKCGGDGGVLAATTNTDIVIEGGHFTRNTAEESGGVFSTRGNMTISNGMYAKNEGSDRGGVFFASDESLIVVENGTFGEENKGNEGGVGYIDSNSDVSIRGGTFTGNSAGNGGGVFFVEEESTFEITSGYFTDNEADFGGFLYKKGEGNVACTGASIVGHKGLDGGALYTLDEAQLEWECDLIENSALVGPAIYARDESVITLRNVVLRDNSVSRGSVVFLVSSTLESHQVVFDDSSSSEDLSAVQADTSSTFLATDTSFVGFVGEVVVFNEGMLVLDSCDFSKSSASVLVSSADAEGTIIRNVVLGDENYANETSDVVDMINVNLACAGVDGEDSSPPCNGALCLEGDMGVYCQCYVEEATGNERCISGDHEGLTLALVNAPAETFFPNLLEGELMLSFHVNESATTSTSAGSSDGVKVEDTIVWNASATLANNVDLSLADWTILPSKGVLSPGESINLRVVLQPSGDFDGTATVTFQVDVMGSFGNQAAAEANMGLTFYHCDAGNFWNSSSDAVDANEGCLSCTDDALGDVDGLRCSEAGASTETLPIKEGYWRANLASITIRECFNQAACVGGSNVTSVAEYCGDGYEGPFCAVCSPEYGRGVSNACHKCTSSFKAGMILLIAVGALITLMVAVLLAAYLIGGVGAVTSTITSTRDSVAVLRERGLSVLLSSSEAKGEKHTNSHGGGVHSTSVPQPKKGQRGAPLPPILSPGRATMPNESKMLRELSILDSRDGSGQTHDDDQCEKAENRSASWEPVYTDGGKTEKGIMETGNPLASPTSARQSRGGQEAENQGSNAAGDGTYDKGIDSLKFGTEQQAAMESTVFFSGRRREHRPPIGNSSLGLATVDEGVEEKHESGSRFDGLRKKIGRRQTGSGNKQEEGGQQGVESGRQANSAKKKEGVESGKSKAKEEEKVKNVAKKIGSLRAKIPLSKLKIIIVVWQISSAFAEITQVPFPAAYEKFLSAIGIFSFDLGWVFSAACINTDITFYHKLLMVTIGPLILLALLGVTFWAGSRPRRTSIQPYEDEGTAFWARASFFRIPRVITRRVSSRTAPSSKSRRSSSSMEQLFSDAGKTTPPRSRRSSNSRPTKASRKPSEEAIEGSEPASTPSFAPAFGGIGSPHQDSSADQTETNRKAPVRQLSRIARELGTDGSVDAEKDRLWGLFSRHTTITLVVLYLVYSSVSTTVFQTFSCQPVSEIKTSYLLADLRITCNTAEHRAYKVYATLMIVFYPLGIPAAFLFFLFRQRFSLNPRLFMDQKPEELRREDEVREQMERRQGDRSVTPTSFLWLAYFPSRYYFEVCECVRRLLLTGLLVFIIPYTTGQVAIGCMFAFISLLVFEYLQPFVDPVDTQLYRAGCLVIFFSNFFALMIKSEVSDPESSGSAVYSVALIAVHTMLFLSVWWNTWVAALAVMSRKTTQDAVLGFEIVGEDELDTVLGKASKSDGNAEVLDESDRSAQELEELEAGPAWERDENSSVLDQMNSVRRLISTPRAGGIRQNSRDGVIM